MPPSTSQGESQGSPGTMWLPREVADAIEPLRPVAEDMVPVVAHAAAAGDARLRSPPAPSEVFSGGLRPWPPGVKSEAERTKRGPRHG